MCHWCDPDAEQMTFEDKNEHDMWLFPHGRYGYTPEEKLTSRILECPWCSLTLFGGR